MKLVYKNVEDSISTSIADQILYFIESNYNHNIINCVSRNIPYGAITHRLFYTEIIYSIKNEIHESEL